MPAEFREWLKKAAGEKAAGDLAESGFGGRESEGFGTKVTGIEVSSAAGEGRSVWVDEKEEALKALDAGVDRMRSARRSCTTRNYFS